MHPKIQGLVCCLNYVYNPNANSVVHWWVMVFGQPLHFGKSWHHPWFCKLLTIWHNIFLLNGVCDLLLTSNAMKKKFHQVFMKQEAGKLILPGSRQTDFRLQTMDRFSKSVRASDTIGNQNHNFISLHFSHEKITWCEM